MLIFVSWIFYGMGAYGVFVLRKKMPDVHRPYKVWGYPLVPAIVILFCVALFIYTIKAKPMEAAIGMGLMLTGIPMWFWFNKRSR